MSKIVAIVPIKLNNERLPGKNTKLLAGKPLIHYVQQNLLSVDQIAERYVYCSQAAVQEYLLPGVVWLQRSACLDEATANFTQIFDSFMHHVPADIYVYAHATAPFITRETTCDCLHQVVSGAYDSAFCATKIQDFLWCDGKPVNFDASNLPRSQDLKPIYRETSGVYVFRREVFEKFHRRIGLHPYIREVTYREAVDINTPEDFALAELWAGLGQDMY